MHRVDHPLSASVAGFVYVVLFVAMATVDHGHCVGVSIAIGDGGSTTVLTEGQTSASYVKRPTQPLGRKLPHGARLLRKQPVVAPHVPSGTEHMPAQETETATKSTRALELVDDHGEIESLLVEPESGAHGRVSDGNVVPTAMDPSLPCEDVDQTGIRFTGGRNATCGDLTHYCQHEVLGGKVLDSCPKTCGLCAITTIDSDWNSTRCTDLGPSDKPEFTIAGGLARCSDLKRFCNDHPVSSEVRLKCQHTCGLCKPSTTSTTTIVSDADEVDGDTDKNRIGGCVRRRRWGFCYSRRRRMA